MIFPKTLTARVGHWQISYQGFFYIWTSDQRLGFFCHWPQQGLVTQSHIKNAEHVQWLRIQQASITATPVGLPVDLQGCHLGSQRYLIKLGVIHHRVYHSSSNSKDLNCDFFVLIHSNIMRTHLGTWQIFASTTCKATRFPPILKSAAKQEFCSPPKVLFWMIFLFTISLSNFLLTQL